MTFHPNQYTDPASFRPSQSFPTSSTAPAATPPAADARSPTTGPASLGPSVSDTMLVKPPPLPIASPTLITTGGHVHPPPPGLASPVVIPMTATASAANYIPVAQTFSTHLNNSSVDSLMNDANDPFTFTLFDKLYACLLDGPRKDLLSQLPYEIATYILQFLDMQHIAKVARISRSWHLLANDNAVWKCIYLIHRGWEIRLPGQTHQQLKPKAIDYEPQAAKASLSAIGTTHALATSAGSTIASSTTAVTPETAISRSASRVTVPSKLSLTSQKFPPRLHWKRLCHDRLMIQQRWSKVPYRNRLHGHSDSVYCIQFDHEKMVTGSRDKTIKFWDIHTLQNTHTLTGHTQSVLCLQFNERIMVSGSSDSTIIVWDMATRTIAHQLRGHRAGVLDVCFDDQYIISCSKDATIKVWDIKTMELLRTMVGHRGPVNAVQLHSGKVVSASGDGLVKLWNVETGVCERDFVGHERGLACVQFDGRTIVSGSNDKTIRIWNAATGECTKILRGHTNLVRTLHFANGRIVSGSYDHTVRVWDMETGQCTLNLNKGGHESWVFDVQFSATKIIR
ncbi:hypothetical protein BGZ73_009010 [Actinomortierella ambigua]|nr:hypothetical protein BGZ73_009010 [Actinomortierella ambigua]